MLPVFYTENKELTMMQNKWKSELDPMLSNPSNNSIILKNVLLTTGNNIINTLIGRKLQGWSIVRQRGPASIYDNQDNNQAPGFTLLLVSSANVSIDLEVF